MAFSGGTTHTVFLDQSGRFVGQSMVQFLETQGLSYRAYLERKPERKKDKKAPTRSRFGLGTTMVIEIQMVAKIWL